MTIKLDIDLYLMFLRWPDSKRRTCLKTVFPVRKAKLTGNSLILCTNYLRSPCNEVILEHMEKQVLQYFSWFTNLEQTALNRCQPLPAPYKRLLNRKQ